MSGTILIADDSAADRAQAGHLLEKRGWAVHYAEDGERALDQLSQRSFDLVLTDMVMPHLDGLGLVERAKTDHPLVPVIVMTSQGSEEIAVRALERGAASYVPKKTLVRDLVDVVERILAISQEQKGHKRLAGCLRTASFTLENDLDLVSLVVAYLTTTLRDAHAFDESDCHRITTALDEALTNAYYHGNLEVRSDVREHDPRAYRALAKARRTQTPYRDRRIHLHAVLDPTEVRFTIRDEGRGFDPRELPDPTRPEHLEHPSGRGVFLMKTFMDMVDYNERGNEVTLVKRRQPLPAPDPVPSERG